MYQLIAAILKTGLSDSVTLSAGNAGTVEAVDGSATYNSTVGVRFLSTGVVEVRRDIDGADSWESWGTWISDTGAINGNEEVRFTGLSGDDWTREAAADNTYVSISTNPEWEMDRNIQGSSLMTVTFEVRDTSTSRANATGVHTMSIDNGVV